MVAEVSGFSKTLGKLKEVPIASIAVAYDCPVTYDTYILVFHQALYIKELETNLICPNQMRMAGVIVNDCPAQFLPVKDRTSNSHAIIYDNFKIPLKLRGIISYFDTRKPTVHELSDTKRYQHIELTSPHTWDPYDNTVPSDEQNILTPNSIDTSSLIDHRTISLVDTTIDSPSYHLHGSRFVQLLESQVLYDYHSLMATNTKRKGTVTASDLAKRWYIGLPAAQRTIQQTTQRGVRDFTSTGGFRRMKHTAHQLLYRHIRAAIYTDTMFSKVKSLKQHTCAQVYVTNFHFTKVYPMRSKSEAHQTLDELHHDVGVFHTIIPDNAKELTEGEFRKKAIHAGSLI
jgi:hypothetical protein